MHRTSFDRLSDINSWDGRQLASQKAHMLTEVARHNGEMHSSEFNKIPCPPPSPVLCLACHEQSGRSLRALRPPCGHYGSKRTTLTDKTTSCMRG